MDFSIRSGIAHDETRLHVRTRVDDPSRDQEKRDHMHGFDYHEATKMTPRQALGHSSTHRVGPTTLPNQKAQNFLTAGRR